MSMREDRRHFAARTYDDGERIVNEAEPDVLRQLDQVGSASTRATKARPDRRASLRRTGSTETEGEEMRGHIRKRAKGWAYVIDLARDPATGKRKQKWVSGFATENTAEKAMRAALVAIDNRRDPFPPNTKMRDYISGWLDEHATQVRPRTIHRYRQLRDQHVLPHLGGHRLNRVHPGTDPSGLEGDERRRSVSGNRSSITGRAR
jgi:hypothetical protein